MTITPSNLAVHARGLAKRFGTVQAVARIGFDLPDGLTPPLWLDARHDGARWHVKSTENDALSGSSNSASVSRKTAPAPLPHGSAACRGLPGFCGSRGLWPP